MAKSTNSKLVPTLYLSSYVFTIISVLLTFGFLFMNKTINKVYNLGWWKLASGGWTLSAFGIISIIVIAIAVILGVCSLIIYFTKGKEGKLAWLNKYTALSVVICLYILLVGLWGKGDGWLVKSNGLSVGGWSYVIAITAYALYLVISLIIKAVKK